jgi:hypothetical protein
MSATGNAANQHTTSSGTSTDSQADPYLYGFPLRRYPGSGFNPCFARCCTTWSYPLTSGWALRLALCAGDPAFMSFRCHSVHILRSFFTDESSHPGAYSVRRHGCMLICPHAPLQLPLPSGPSTPYRDNCPLLRYVIVTNTLPWLFTPTRMVFLNGCIILIPFMVVSGGGGVVLC